MRYRRPNRRLRGQRSRPGWPKPTWQSVFGNPGDGVRVLPDVCFAADGMWGHFYVFCFSEAAPCTAAIQLARGGGRFLVSHHGRIQTLINQVRRAAHPGNPNPVYYEIAQSQYGQASARAACD